MSGAVGLLGDGGPLPGTLRACARSLHDVKSNDWVDKGLRRAS